MTRFRVPVVVLVSLLLVMVSAAPALAAYFVGTRGGDDIRGTGRADEIYGLRGGDDLRGRGGDDYIEGGTGFDNIFGDEGEDEIYGGAGEDNIRGGGGDDYINSADDGRSDRVDCGGGTNDTVVYDATEDTLVDPLECEVQHPV